MKSHHIAHRQLRTDPIMAGLIGAVGPRRIAALGGLVSLEHRSPYESLGRAIAHQQLNGKAAQSILARLEGHFGQRFPTPEELLAANREVLRAAGFSYAKIAALKDLAAKTLEGVVPETAALEPLSDLAIIERLTSVRGIGRWTVEMMLIFQLGRPDVLPVADFGVCNGFRLAYGLSGMPQPRALDEFGERWKPHRSLAAWYLWRAVELERSGTLPRCTRRPRMAIRKLAGKLAPAARRPGEKLSTTKRAPVRATRIARIARSSAHAERRP
jgi:DNA-3-methyladenine glycosylase II